MKKPSLVHGAWCVAAIASFVLGSHLFPAGGDSSADGSDSRPDSQGGGNFRASSRSDGSPSLAEKRHRDGRATGDSQVGLPARLVLSEQDIASLGEQFRMSPNPVERRLAFSRLLEGLTPENARLMREQIAHLSDDSAEFREFHYAWGAIAGAEAVMLGADTKKTDMAATLAGWAGADPQAATKWFNDLQQDDDKTGANKNNLAIGMVHGLANADPELATRFVLDLAAAGDGKANWMIGIVTGKVLGAEGPTGAAAWAQDLPPGSVRAGALSQVARYYARKDPQAAVAWLESIPASGDTARGMQSAFSTWAGSDPTTAGQHLNQMPASSDRDWAVSGYAPRVAHENGASGLEWVESINDPEVREQTLIRTAQVFYHHGDKQEVREWLPNSGLSPEAQQQVLRGRGHGR